MPKENLAMANIGAAHIIRDLLLEQGWTELPDVVDRVRGKVAYLVTSEGVKAAALAPDVRKALKQAIQAGARKLYVHAVSDVMEADALDAFWVGMGFRYLMDDRDGRPIYTRGVTPPKASAKAAKANGAAKPTTWHGEHEIPVALTRSGTPVVDTHSGKSGVTASVQVRGQWVTFQPDLGVVMVTWGNDAKPKAAWPHLLRVVARTPSRGGAKPNGRKAAVSRVQLRDRLVARAQRRIRADRRSGLLGPVRTFSDLGQFVDGNTYVLTAAGSYDPEVDRMGHEGAMRFLGEVIARLDTWLRTGELAHESTARPKARARR
jgi:hypothetical protein